MHESDTICAVSTPPGEGGIGIIRVSGKDAFAFVSRIFRPRIAGTALDTRSHSLQYGHIVSPDTGETVDEVLVSAMRAPASYTREDVAEINCHGGMVPLSRTLSLLIAAGARQAEPGEFTKRAFLNGRIDLSQAEAVMDVIRAKTDLAHRAAQEQLLGGLSREIASLRDRLLAVTAAVEAGIDFPEEDIEIAGGGSLEGEITSVVRGVETMLSTVAGGRILRDGFATAIVGRPNVGKSSLLNALLRHDRAIVTDIPGTTRDVLEEYLNISGVPIRILDTAGIRHSHDVVEQEGVRRSLAALESADMAVAVLDGSQELSDEDRRVLEAVQNRVSIIAVNKTDLPEKIGLFDHPAARISISCRTGKGIEELRHAISGVVLKGTAAAREHAWAVNQRHQTALEEAREDLARALESARSGLSSEFIALDLRAALDHLGSVIGATYTEDILKRIFDDFCIGK